MRYVIGLIGVSAMFWASAAWSATVQVQGGEVFIDRGNGYSKINGSAPGNPGDVVMAKVGGSAVIVYGDGCTQAVEVGSVVTIPQTPPCAIGALQPDYTLIVGGVVVAGGIAAAIVLSDDDDKPASGE